MTPARLLGASALGLLILAGCLGRSPQTTFYMLTPLPPDASVASAAPGGGRALGVGPARLPRYLDRPQIVTRRGSQLSYDELHRWAGSLESELLRVLGANLALLLGTERVAVYPAEPRFPDAIHVVLEVDRFDGERGEAVTLQARWILTAEGRGEPLAVGTSTLSEPVRSRRSEDLVAAHSAALAALSREIAERIRSLDR
jgi:uncharacterized lipoprotein YmbA